MSKNVILFLNKHQVFYNLPVWGTKEETKNSQTLYSDIEKKILFLILFQTLLKSSLVQA